MVDVVKDLIMLSLLSNGFLLVTINPPSFPATNQKAEQNLSAENHDERDGICIESYIFFTFASIAGFSFVLISFIF